MQLQYSLVKGSKRFDMLYVNSKINKDIFKEIMRYLTFSFSATNHNVVCWVQKMIIFLNL